jgi:hypothetical protein
MSEKNNNSSFWSIGEDETGIPIVATRVETDGPNKKKLVIAGSHGDERNAQRVIMATQRYFINEGDIPDDLALYFIPCLSPTMCFADARGIPLVDMEGTRCQGNIIAGNTGVFFSDASVFFVSKNGVHSFYDLIRNYFNERSNAEEDT